MAAKGEKRSPTAHRTPSQIRKHGRTYQATAEQRNNRSLRNSARRHMVAAGKAHKGDGRDVGHRVPMLRKRHNTKAANRASNLVMESRRKNRGHGLRRT